MQENIKEKAQRAFKLAQDFDLKYSECAQATLYGLQSVYDLKDDDVFKGMGTLAGGGLHRCDGTCGVYAAGIFFLGILAGRGYSDLDNADDPGAHKKMDRIFLIADKLYKKFIQKYGSIKCADIQRKMLGRAYFLRDEDEMRRFKEDGGYGKDAGPGLVGSCAKWTVEIIEEHIMKNT